MYFKKLYERTRLKKRAKRKKLKPSKIIDYPKRYTVSAEVVDSDAILWVLETVNDLTTCVSKTVLSFEELEDLMRDVCSVHTHIKSSKRG